MAALSHTEYETLSKEDQISLLWQLGNFLATYSMADAVYLLYDMDYFYVEISYKPESKKLIAIRSFTDAAFLEPYVEHIEISQLM